jgi:HEAT repeat protein
MDSSHIQHLLYEDEDGQIIGLDEVQLLEPVPTNRIPEIRQLLDNNDLNLVFQATLVLAAWGDKAGFNKISELIDKKIHNQIQLAPHRLYGYDNVYDLLAEAIEIYGYTQQDHKEIIDIYRKLLDLYGECTFESRLKIALLNHQYDVLANEVIQAINRAINNKRYYLASQLLPVLAKWGYREIVKTLISNFMTWPQHSPNPLSNVAESLRYLHDFESLSLLNTLQNHQDSSVSEQAKASLYDLSQRNPRKLKKTTIKQNQNETLVRPIHVV